VDHAPDSSRYRQEIGLFKIVSQAFGIEDVSIQITLFASYHAKSRKYYSPPHFIRILPENLLLDWIKSCIILYYKISCVMMTTAEKP
jgi:hypothetical protein